MPEPELWRYHECIARGEHEILLQARKEIQDEIDYCRRRLAEFKSVEEEIPDYNAAKEFFYHEDNNYLKE